MLAKSLSDFEMQNRLAVVERAIDQINLFIDNILLFDLYSENFIKMHAGELDPGQ